MSNPPYNPYASEAQRSTQYQYGLTNQAGPPTHLGSGSGLGSSRASSGPSTNSGGMISSMHPQTMSHGPGQSRSTHTADMGSTIDMHIRGAREELKLLSQLVQQKRQQKQATDWDTRLTKNPREEKSSLGVGLTNYPSSSSTSHRRLVEHSDKQSGGGSSMDWSSSYQAPSSASISNSPSSSSSSAQYMSLSHSSQSSNVFQNMPLSHSSQSTNVFQNMDLSHSPQSSKLFLTSSYTAAARGSSRITSNEQGDTVSSKPGLVDYSLSDQPSSSLTTNRNRPKYTLDSAANILGKFGLENEDIQDLNDYIDDEITPENLPSILRDIHHRKIQKATAASRSDMDCQHQTGSGHFTASGGGLRRQEESTPILHQPSKVIDYGHSSKYTAGFGHEISGGNENMSMMDRYSSSSHSRELKDFGTVKSSGAGSSRDQINFSGSSSYGSMLSSVTSASPEPPNQSQRPEQTSQSILSAFQKLIKEPISPPKLYEDNRILEPKPPKSILLKKPALVPPKQSQGLKQTSESILNAFQKLIKEPISPSKEDKDNQTLKSKPPKSILVKKLSSTTTSPQRRTLVHGVNPSPLPLMHPLPLMTAPPPPPKPPAATTVTKRLPTPAMMSDYSAVTPRIFPHTCSLCNIDIEMKDWISHQNSNHHIESCRLLRKTYPDWKGEIAPAPSRDVQLSSSQSSRHHHQATRGSHSHSGPLRYARSRSPSTRRYSRSRSQSPRRYSRSPRSHSPGSRRYSRSSSSSTGRYSRSSSSSTGRYSRSRSHSPRHYSRSRSSGPRRYSRSRSPGPRCYSRSRSPSPGRYSRTRSPGPLLYHDNTPSRSTREAREMHRARSRSPRSPRYKRRSFSRSPHYSHHSPQRSSHSTQRFPQRSPYHSSRRSPYHSPQRSPYHSSQRFPYHSPQRSPYHSSQRSPYRSPQRAPYRSPQRSPHHLPPSSSCSWSRNFERISQESTRKRLAKRLLKTSAAHSIPDCSSLDDMEQTPTPALVTEFTTLKSSSSSRSSSKGSKRSSSHPSKGQKRSSPPSSSTSKTTSALRSQDVSFKKPKKENPFRRITSHSSTTKYSPTRSDTTTRRPVFPTPEQRPLLPTPNIKPLLSMHIVKPLFRHKGTKTMDSTTTSTAKVGLLPTPNIKPLIPLHMIKPRHVVVSKAKAVGMKQAKTQQDKKVAKVATRKTTVKGSSSKAKTMVKMVKKPKIKQPGTKESAAARTKTAETIKVTETNIKPNDSSTPLSEVKGSVFKVKRTVRRSKQSRSAVSRQSGHTKSDHKEWSKPKDVKSIPKTQANKTNDGQPKPDDSRCKTSENQPMSKDALSESRDPTLIPMDTSTTVAPPKDAPKDSTIPAKVVMETAFQHSTASSKAETMATSNGATMATALKAQHPCFRHPETKRVEGLSYHQGMGFATDDFKDHCILPSDTCPSGVDDLNWEEFVTLDEVGDVGDKASCLPCNSSSSSSDRRRSAKIPSVPEQSSRQERISSSSSVDKQSWKESSQDFPKTRSSSSSSSSNKKMESKNVSKTRQSATLVEARRCAEHLLKNVMNTEVRPGLQGSYEGFPVKSQNPESDPSMKSTEGVKSDHNLSANTTAEKTTESEAEMETSVKQPLVPEKEGVEGTNQALRDSPQDQSSASPSLEPGATEDDLKTDIKKNQDENSKFLNSEHVQEGTTIKEGHLVDQETTESERQMETSVKQPQVPEKEGTNQAKRDSPPEGKEVQSGASPSIEPGATEDHLKTDVTTQQNKSTKAARKPPVKKSKSVRSITQRRTTRSSATVASSDTTSETTVDEEVTDDTATSRQIVEVVNECM